MERRNFVTAIAGAAAIMALPATSLAAHPTPSTFSDDDTLVQRAEKLNALMGTDYEVDVTYPKEWDTRQLISRDELLGAQYPRLTYGLKDPPEWNVYFKCNGERCSRDMNPFEFFHYTSAIAWQYRNKKH